MNNQHTKGSALLSALLITAIIAIIASLIAHNQMLTLQLAETSIQGGQQTVNLTSATNLFIQTLAENPKQLIAHSRITWTNTQQNATIKITLVDQNGLFNLNALQDQENIPSFVKFLTLIDPHINPYHALKLSNELYQFTTPSNSDEIYTRLHPPYRAPHLRLSDTSELMLLQQMSSGLLQKLKPYITLLPENNLSINVNTAAPPVLALLEKTTRPGEDKRLQACQLKHKPFQSVEQFSQTCLVSKHKPSIDGISLRIDSHFYLLNASIQTASQTYQMSQLMRLTWVPTSIHGKKAKRAVFSLIWRKY